MRASSRSASSSLIARSIPLRSEGDLGDRGTAPPPDWAARLLAFWFDGRGPDDWYGGGPDFDAAVRHFAAHWGEALRALPPAAFLTDPHTAPAAAIPFAPVPRNLYRGAAQALATARPAPAPPRPPPPNGRHPGRP